MAAPAHKTIALITGANKGIGFTSAKFLASQHGFHVIIGSRNPEAGEKAAAEIRAVGHAAFTVQLDVTSEPSIEAAIQAIDRDFGYLDVLINNAGIFLDPSPWIPDAPRFSTAELFAKTFATNVTGPAVLTEGLLPLLRKAKAKPARIVFLTSSLGSLKMSAEEHKDMPDWKAYDASKAAANMLGVQYARLLKGDGIKVNVVCPGLVATDMTGHVSSGSTVELGAESTVKMATIGEDGPTGTFVDRNGPLPW